MANFRAVTVFSYILLHVFDNTNTLHREDDLRFTSGAIETRLNYRFIGHVYKTHTSPSLISCGQLCLRNPQCVSTNFKLPKGNEKGVCELNDWGLTNPNDNENLMAEEGVVFSQYEATKNNISDDHNVHTQKADYALEFPTKGTHDYVVVRGMRTLTSFTVCLWMNSSDTGDKGTPLSYAVQDEHNEIVIDNYNDFRLSIGGDTSNSFSVSATDGKWHHICFTWENAKGTCKFYKDGQLAGSDDELNENHVIKDGGYLVLGQEQDAQGGGFESDQSFVGQMTNIDIWDYVLSEEKIKILSKSCLSGEGNVFKWVQFKDKLRGGVRVIEPSTCKPEALVVPPS